MDWAGTSLDATFGMNHVHRTPLRISLPAYTRQPYWYDDLHFQLKRIMLKIEEFIRGLPKAELHMHLEGSIEPDLMLKLAERNGIDLQWNSVEALREAYKFDSLQSFLNLFYAGTLVLVEEQDFFEMTMAYLRRANDDNVRRAEITISLPVYLQRGMKAETVLRGVLAAIDQARVEFGISTGLMLSIQRHRNEDDIIAIFDVIDRWKDSIVAIGLGGAERGNPPGKFARFFKMCQHIGLPIIVHAGEEGPASYINEALELGSVRIDHGNACVEDVLVMERLARQGTPLTLCPVSNLRLKVIESMSDHPIRRMIDAGINVTINSDDPSYFEAYVNDNYLAVQEAFELSPQELAQIAKNSFQASLMSPTEKQRFCMEVDEYVQRVSSDLGH